MMSAIKVFEKGSDERRALEAAAALFTAFDGRPHVVDETYFDYGQDWKWTTILYESGPVVGFGWVQALTPRDQEDIIAADGLIELATVVNGIIERKKTRGW